MASRRRFLGTLGMGSLALVNAERSLAFVQQLQARADISAADLAMDETFWMSMQEAFDVDRSIINLNNGGVSPSPRVVMEAQRQYLDQENTAPSYTMWRHLEPNVEHVRNGLARMFAVDPEEIALTRNASESLQIVQQGMSLKAGDEIVTTSQDYPRMITTFEQRVRREGLVLKKVDYPVPLMNADDYVHAIEEAISPKTKLILVSHVCFMTGQILPVARITKLARERGIECIVDGAHAFNHFPFTQQDLGCDYYGTSLHKWTHAPIGTGMLFVRKEKIPAIWPLMAAGKDQDDNIRKFEEIGTHPAALHNAVGAAIMFNESLGINRKAARLRALHHHWIDRVSKHDNVKFYSNTHDESNWCGILVFSIEGIDTDKLSSYLFDKHRIVITGISHPQFKGIRVSPSTYTRMSEMTEFADVIESVATGKCKDIATLRKEEKK